MQMNETDRNDAEGLAQIMRTGWYRPVHVKSLDAHRARALLGARAQLVRSKALETEYQSFRAAAAADQPPDAEGAQTQDFEREVARLTALSLADLGARLGAAATDITPAVLARRTQRFKRDPPVAAYARARGAFRCEVPGGVHPAFEDRDGRPYSKVHRIEPLAEGGPDTPANVASVCPAHRREAHHGRQAGEIRATLAGLRRLEPDRFR